MARTTGGSSRRFSSRPAPTLASPTCRGCPGLSRCLTRNLAPPPDAEKPGPALPRVLHRLCIFVAGLCLALRPRVRLVVDFCQILKVQVRIDLGAGYACVPEHLLHGAQVTGGLQHVRGERMPKHVRMNMPAQSALARPCSEPGLDRARPDAAPRTPDEHGMRIANRQTGTHGEPRPDRLARRTTDRNDALLGALAPHAHLPGREVDRAEVEPRELGEP